MLDVRRRQFITLLGGAAATWPFGARAQRRERLRRIGVLMHTSANDTESQRRVAALLRVLQELGWTEGRNVQIDLRWAAGDTALAHSFAKELVDLQPDVLFGNGYPQVPALLQATNTIPIVFANVSDPVGAGLVASLARPGGNVTGFSNQEFKIAGKRLELLKEIAPTLTRVAVVFHADSGPHFGMWRETETLAPSVQLKAIAAGVRNAAEIERAITAFAGEPDGGLIVLSASVTQINRELIGALALRHRLPAIYQLRYFAEAGGLMALGSSSVEPYRQAASYLDRILKGEKAADLPVQLPTRYELVINLKTAKALGLGVPATLLARADEVIE
jgi:putative tryptophan/tyrosine transport system substrate-binding protein